MRLLLDTHVLVWLVEGSPRLGHRARAAIEAGAVSDGILLSAFSFWEIAMLARSGRLALTVPMLEWHARTLDLPGLVEVPLNSEIAVEAVFLPGNPHGDPADRLIIATARVTGARLVTQDRAILAYAAAGHVDALAA